MHTFRLSTVLLTTALASALCLTGCDDKKPAPTADGAKTTGGNMMDKAKEVGASASTAASDAWKSVRDEAVKTSESALASTKSMLDGAGEKIAKLPEAAQGAAKSALEAAKTQYDAAAAKVAELKTADSTSWTAISTSLKDMVAKLGDASKSLADKLK